MSVAALRARMDAASSRIDGNIESLGHLIIAETKRRRFIEQLAELIEDVDPEIAEELFADEVAVAAPSAPVTALALENAAPAAPEALPATVRSERTVEPVVAKPAAKRPALSPKGEARKAPAAEPEAPGLKQADMAMLMIMRANTRAGVCGLTLNEIATKAGLNRHTAGGRCTTRLKDAGLIDTFRDGSGRMRYHVAEKGARLPIASPVKPKAAAPPAALPAPVSRAPVHEIRLDAKVFDLITRAAAANGGAAIYGVDKLAALVETSPFQLDVSLTRLAQAGKLLRLKSLPGHVTFEVLQGAKVAA